MRQDRIEADFRARLGGFVDNPQFGNFIIGVIILNAILLGMETAPSLMKWAGPVIEGLDKVCLGIFIVELAMKMVARGPRFFRDGWNCFDFIIIGIALMPGAGGLSVLRALRILRVLRVISVAPRLRNVVEGFITALPGMASVFLLMAIIFYIGSVMATRLFGEDFPQWFGDLGLSAYSLFQIMTLESWSMGIVRPVMEIFPYAWAFFVPFIMVTTFAVVNLLVGLIVNSMQETSGQEEGEKNENFRSEVLTRLESIEARLSETGRSRAEK